MSQKLQQPLKYLLIDDQLVSNQRNKNNFIEEIGVSQNLGLFAQDYAEAVDIIKNNQNLAVCYVDLRIPKDSTSTGRELTYNPEGEEWGLSLIPLINEIHKKTKIVVYSAHVGHEQIEKFIDKFQNILGVFGKPNKLRHLQQLYYSAVEEVGNLNIPIATKKTSKRSPIKLQVSESINTPIKRSDRKYHKSTNYSSNDLDAKKRARKETNEFNYSHLDRETRDFILNRTVEIKSLVRKTVEDIIEIGRYLSEVKQRIPGNFVAWLEYEMQWSTASAARFVSAYERVTELNIDVSKYDIYPTALYLLTPRTMPDTALLEMKEIAEAGTVINSEVAKQIREKHFKSKNKQNNLSTSDLIPTKVESTQGNGTNLSISDKPSLFQESSSNKKQNIVKIIPAQRIWKFDKHLIICADPHSSTFIEQLPSRVPLSLAFPNDKNWYFQSQLNIFQSFNIFYSPQDTKKENDIDSLLDAVQNLIDFSTEPEDHIAVCFCPYPEIIQVITDMNCSAIIAEPNQNQCAYLLNYFQQNLKS